jgi:tetratricopeptide (TPR) repeat protein
MKKACILLLLSALIFQSPAYAQFGKDLLNKTKDKAEREAREKKEKVVGDANLKDGLSNRNLGIIQNKLGDKLSELSSRLDASTFNYAIALSDNAGLYENKTVGKEIFQKVNLVSQADLDKETPVQRASGKNQVGEMFFGTYKFKSAESNYDASMRIIEESSLQSQPLYALVNSNKGLLYETTGRYEQAQAFTQKALELRKAKAEENPEGYAASLNNMAVLQRDMGQYDEAEATINEALKYQEKVANGKKSVPYALMLNNKSMIYQTVGRYDAAEPIMKQAIEVADESMNQKSPGFQRYRVNLALLYLESGKYEESEKILTEAAKRLKARLGDDHPDYARVLNHLAALYMKTGKYDKVKDNLEKALSIYKKKFGENHPEYAETLYNLGNYYRVQGKIQDAEPLLQQAITIRKNTLGEAHPKYIDALESMALLRWQDKKYNLASDLFKQVLDKEMNLVRMLFPSMSEAEKAKFWDRLSPKFQRFYAFAVQASASQPALLGDMYNYRLETKGLLLSVTNKIKNQILSGKDEDLKKKYRLWLDGKENLAKIYSLSKEELQEEKINRDSLEQAVNGLEKELSKSTLFAAGYQSKPVTFKTIQAKIAPDAAVLEMVRFNQFDILPKEDISYAVLVLTKDKPLPQLALLENGKELETKYYAFYKNAITKQQSDKFACEQYWTRIEKVLGSKKTVYVSSDGIYNQINLNTLQTPDGKYLIDSRNFVFLTNSKDILLPVSPVGKLSAVLVGFPNYGKSGSISPLPGTKAEVETINTMLKGKGYATKTYLADNASEKNLKNVSNPKILHIATHGYFLKDVDDIGDEKVFGVEPEKARENPMLRGGLLLAGAEATAENTDTRQAKSNDNGIFTAYEASLMNLEGNEVTILSACETGGGDVKNGEGVYGLQRAFQIAGAKTLLMSLWKVSDAATVQLMSNFYKNLTPGVSKVQAFKNAQQELRTQFKNPYFWGAFVMIGN